MIRSYEEYQATRDYAERLQKILLDLRKTHSASQFESLSKGYIKELTKAQREITLYLATPVSDAA